MNLLAYVHLRRIHNATGAGRVVRNLVEQIDAAGHDELRILADMADHAAVVPLVGEPWSGFRYHDFPAGTSRQQLRWLALGAPRAERWWPEAEIVWCTAESYVPTRTAKLAVTINDAAYFERTAHAPTPGFRVQRAKWRVLFDRIERRADLVHTVSHFSAERLAHVFPGMRDRIRVVHNGVSPRFFAPPNVAGETALATLGLAGRRFVLVPGGLSYRKNADLVLAAWPRLHALFPDLTLVVASSSEPHYAAQARALGGSIVETGFVDDDLLVSLYHAAELMWFPSRYEGFGIPPLEAMLSGTAVVASSASSIPEIVGDAALLADPASPDAHIGAIEALLNDASAREQLQAAGRARAQGFRWDASAAALRLHFQDLL